MKNTSTETPKLEKKLKQARLPFQVLSPRSSGSDGPPACKKRKLSTSVEDKQNIKKVAHVKENLKSENQGNNVDIIELNSDDDEQEVTENVLKCDKSKQFDAVEVELEINAEHDAVNDSVTSVDHMQIESVSDDDINITQQSDILTEEDVQLTMPISANKQLLNKISDNENVIPEALSEKESDTDTSLSKVNEDDVFDNEGESEDDDDSKSVSNMSASSNPNETTINSVVTSSTISETDEILDSNECLNIITPNEKRKRKCTTVDESVQAKKTPDIKKNLTPKQLQRKLELARLKEEKEKVRQDAFRKRQEERLKRKQEKDEEKKKEREEKEKEREEKERKRLAEIEKKNEEKRLKDEEKRVKDEEKRKKEEQKEEERKKKEQEKEEAENKKKKAAAAFVNFFVPRKVDEKKTDDYTNTIVIREETDKIKVNNFMPFCIKADMRLAPIVRKTLSDENKRRLEHSLQNTDTTDNYLVSIKKGKYILGKCGKTWPISEEVKDDLMIIDEVGESFVEVLRPTRTSKAKLILFHENRRPPYWGTWTKISNDVGPRTPFGKDKIFDYEIDSDSEWEEEEPGESLHGSDDEKDKEESEDEYEVDNDFFVPHGYLSDEEQNDEEKEPDSPEIQKAKLKLMQTEFNEEMKKKTEKIKPRLVGCVWVESNGERPQKCAEVIWSLLCSNRMIIDEPIVLDIPEDICNSSGEAAAATGSFSKKSRLHEDLIPDLIKLIHGNINNRKFLVCEYQAYLQKCQQTEENKSLFEVSNIAIARKIKEIGQYKMCREESGNNINRCCWCVDVAIREKYNLADLSLINSWKYILTPKNKERQVEVAIVTDKSETTKEKRKSGNNIKKFTKVLSAEDRQKQFVPQSATGDDGNCSVAPQLTSEQKIKKLVKKKSTIRRKLIPSQNTTLQQRTDVDKTKQKTSPIIKSRTHKDTDSVPKKRAVLISVPLFKPMLLKEKSCEESTVANTKAEDTNLKTTEENEGTTNKNEDCVILKNRKNKVEHLKESKGITQVENPHKKRIPPIFLGSLKSSTTKDKVSKLSSNASDSNSKSKVNSSNINKNSTGASKNKAEEEVMDVDGSIVLSD